MSENQQEALEQVVRFEQLVDEELFLDYLLYDELWDVLLHSNCLDYRNPKKSLYQFHLLSHSAYELHLTPRLPNLKMARSAHSFCPKDLILQGCQASRRGDSRETAREV